ncbi:hypothetical protein JCM10295v2_003736 [Rhodotorula toruloides]
MSPALMSRRARTFHPSATRESFKDLLIFEERLKQNAERLQKQRRKYEAFLFSLVGVIVYLGYGVFVLPSIYSLVHYGNIAMLLVAVTTLILFFATGMYSEKIAYAHKFVPQANRALRPFNIYLNTRHRSRFSLSRLFGSSATTTLSRTPSGRSLSPLSELSSPPLSRRTSASSAASSTDTIRSTGAFRSPPHSPPLAANASPPPSPSRRTVPLPETIDDGPVTRAPPSPPPTPSPRSGIPIPPIPPAQNSRGELIFSSRVNPQFREGYERYRAEWERRRAEAKRVQREAQGKTGWRGWMMPWRRRGMRPPMSAEPAKEKSVEEKRGGAAKPPLSMPKFEHGGDGDSFGGPFPPTRSSSHDPHGDHSSTVLSPTSTPASSLSRSSSPSRLAAESGRSSPVRIRAESFSELLTQSLDEEGEGTEGRTQFTRGPGLERSGSMRATGS